jgi:hypothetical protein
MLQPHIPQQCIIAFLVKNELPIASQTRINLSMLVKIRSVVPTAVSIVQVEDHAFTDVDEETCVFAASIPKS